MPFYLFGIIPGVFVLSSNLDLTLYARQVLNLRFFYLNFPASWDYKPVPQGSE